MIRILLVASALAACGAPTRPAPAPTAASAGPCEGPKLELADVLRACSVNGARLDDPPATALRATVEPVEVVSGGQANAVLVLTNTTAGALTFEVADGCDEFETSLETSDGKPVSYENDCAFGALCGGGRRARVTLPPHGVLRAAVPVAATVRRLVHVGEGCEERPEGAVAPGRYRLTISLPFADLDEHGTHVQRNATGDATVVAR